MREIGDGGADEGLGVTVRGNGGAAHGRDERNRLAVQMMKLVNDDAAAYVVYANLAVKAHIAALRGSEIESRDTPAPFLNIQDWEMS